MPFDKFTPATNREVCMSREHNPPNMMVYKPGTYTWRCPHCGKTQTFTVTKPTC